MLNLTNQHEGSKNKHKTFDNETYKLLINSQIQMKLLNNSHKFCDISRKKYKKSKLSHEHGDTSKKKMMKTDI